MPFILSGALNNEKKMLGKLMLPLNFKTRSIKLFIGI